MSNLSKIAPVLMCYIAMGFVDIVGVSVGYAKRDFNLSPETAQLLPSMVFIWFFILSIPIGVFQNNNGKKKTLLIGLLITAVGMFTPFLTYSFPILLLCFVLLGIGNTIIQVSSNPLLQEIVSKRAFSSYMSLSQFIKAISSLLGPILVTVLVGAYSNWKLVFFIYGLVSIISALWLWRTNIKESVTENKASFKTTLSLLRNPLVLAMVISIFLVVGIDVGMNTNIQNYLIDNFGLDLESASLGISVYFFALIISRFLGAIFLAKVDNMKFFFWSALLTLILLFAMVFANELYLAYAIIFLIGITSGNLFPVIFSLTVNKMPERSSEISGLMIMAVVGGAVIPPIMGIVNSNFSISYSFLVLVLSALYIFYSFFLFKKNQ